MYKDACCSFFATSLLLDGECHIDNISFELIEKICKDKTDNLLIMKEAFARALDQYPSYNGEKIYYQIVDKIKSLRSSHEDTKDTNHK